MKNSEQYKRIFRLGLVALLFVIEMFVFLYVWRTYYSNLMEITYAKLGHWMIVAVYGIMLCIFTVIFAGWKIGYLRMFNMVYLQSLTTVWANIIIYLQIVLLTRHFYSVVPILLMTATDIIVIAIWSPIVSLLYRVIYPPRKVLMVYAERWSQAVGIQTFFLLFYKDARLFAYRANLRCLIAVVNIATNGTYKFLLCHIH